MKATNVSASHFGIGKFAIVLFLLVVSVFSGARNFKADSAYAQNVPDVQVPEDHPLFDWSPTENIVVYRSLNSNAGGPGLQPFDLYFYNADTGSQVLLAKDGYSGPIQFSRDGVTISYWYNNQPFIAWVDGVDVVSQEVSTDALPVKGTYSSDNSLLIYVTAADEVRVRDLSEERETSLGFFTDVSTSPNMVPEWSPNGEWVAFGTMGEALLIDPQGRDAPIKLSNFLPPQSEVSALAHYFRWSDEGRYLYSNDQLLYTDESQVERPPALEDSRVSFDGSYRIIDSGGELALLNLASREQKALTSNKMLIEEYLDQSRSTNGNIIQAVATGFDYPVGKPDAVGYNTTAGCWWLQTTGACAPGPHPGQDFNGNGGGDTDLGDPVYAVANGTVVFSAVGSGTSWGNIIMIEHSLPDGSKVWSQYAHLKDRYYGSGATVNKGDQIGTIGKGYNNIYSAHLHFEIRTQYRAADAWISGWTVDQVQQYYVNPSDYINSHRSIGGSSCPNVSGEVRLFDGTNCGGSQYTASGTGLFDMASSFNDKAESIAIPSGWSARLYADNNESSPNVCITSTDSNLGDNTFNNGGAVANQATWVRVYNNSSCSGSGGGTGNWRAEYYDTIDRWWDNNNGNNHKCGEDITGPFLDKNYGTSGPCGMDGETWIGDYSATINFTAGNYVFLIDHDDGAKLWLNGSNIADYGGSGSTTPVCPARYLNGNATLRAMLREDGGDARIKVSWTTDTSACIPAAPSNLRAASTSQNSISLAWNDNSGNENGFRVYRWGGTDWQNIGTVGSNATSYTDASLSCGVTYYYQVGAYNDSGETWNIGGYLTTQTSACPTAPSTPENFRVTGSSQSTITIAWNDVSNETGYMIYRWNGEVFEYLTALSANTTTFTDIILPCDADQFYEVSASNTIGESAHTGWIVGRTTSCAGVCSPVRSISVSGFDARRNDSIGSTDVIIKYGDVSWNESGPEFTYSLDVTRDQIILVELSNMDVDLDIFVLSNVSGQCHSTNLIAYGNSWASFAGEAGKRYYLVVDGYYGSVGDYRIDVTGFSKVYLPLLLR